MPCKRFARPIALAAGGDLGARAERRLARHLETCPACRTAAAEMRRARRALTGLREAPVAAAELARLRTAVLERLSVEERRRPAWAPLPRLAAAVAVLAVLAVGLWLVAPLRLGERLPPAPVAVQPTPAERLPAPAPVAAQPTPTERPPEAAAAPDAAVSPAAPRVARALTPAPVAPGPPGVAAPAAPAEPMVIKLVSDRRDIVIYWLVDAEENDNDANHTPTSA